MIIYLIIHIIFAYLAYFRNTASDYEENTNQTKKAVLISLLFSWIWFVYGVWYYFDHNEKIFFKLTNNSNEKIKIDGVRISLDNNDDDDDVLWH